MSNCTLHEVDFTSADFTASDFTKSDFKGATFEQTILQKCDFRNAINYQIHPDSNRIRQSKFSSDSIQGLLHAFEIIIE